MASMAKLIYLSLVAVFLLASVVHSSDSSLIVLASPKTFSHDTKNPLKLTELESLLLSANALTINKVKLKYYRVVVY
jgi:hypothetical protein